MSSRALKRFVEATTEHIHREFQGEFGFSMTIQELVALENALTKNIGDAVRMGRVEEKSS